MPNTYTHPPHLAVQTPGLQGKQEQQQSTKTCHAQHKGTPCNAYPQPITRTHPATLSSAHSVQNCQNPTGRYKYETQTLLRKHRIVSQSPDVPHGAVCQVTMRRHNSSHKTLLTMQKCAPAHISPRCSPKTVPKLCSPLRDPHKGAYNQPKLGRFPRYCRGSTQDTQMCHTTLTVDTKHTYLHLYTLVPQQNECSPTLAVNDNTTSSPNKAWNSISGYHPFY